MIVMMMTFDYYHYHYYYKGVAEGSNSVAGRGGREGAGFTIEGFILES